MHLRKDALVGAADVVAAVNRAALSHQPHACGTVGCLQAYPGSRNVIPGEVRMTLDFRHLEGEQLDAMIAEVRQVIDSTCQRHGLSYTLTPTADFLPCTSTQVASKPCATRRATWAWRTWTSSAVRGTTRSSSPSLALQDDLRTLRRRHQPQRNRECHARGPGGRLRGVAARHAGGFAGDCQWAPGGLARRQTIEAAAQPGAGQAPTHKDSTTEPVDGGYLSVEPPRSRPCSGGRCSRVNPLLQGEALAANASGVSTSRNTPASSTSSSTQQSRCERSTERAPSSPVRRISSGQKVRPNTTGCPCRPHARATGCWMPKRPAPFAARCPARSRACPQQDGDRVGIAVLKRGHARREAVAHAQGSIRAGDHPAAGRQSQLLHAFPSRSTTRTSSNTAKACSTLCANRLRPSARGARRLSLPKRALRPAASTNATTVTAPRGRCRCGYAAHPQALPRRFPQVSCCPGSGRWGVNPPQRLLIQLADALEAFAAFL